MKRYSDYVQTVTNYNLVFVGLVDKSIKSGHTLVQGLHANFWVTRPVGHSPNIVLLVKSLDLKG